MLLPLSLQSAQSNEHWDGTDLTRTNLLDVGLRAGSLLGGWFLHGSSFLSSRSCLLSGDRGLLRSGGLVSRCLGLGNGWLLGSTRSLLRGGLLGWRFGVL